MNSALPKRLIEVDLPIKQISVFAREEKDSRVGHIPRLHIYPAARPIAACRAVACAALWPDPVDPLVPADFIQKVVYLIKSSRQLLRYSSPSTLTIAADIDSTTEESGILREKVRQWMLAFVGDYSRWEAGGDAAYNSVARKLTVASHQVLAPGSLDDCPLVVDCFAGGGAFPLEALRIGARAFANDANPLSIIINKTILQYAPRYGQRLASDIEEFGNSINGLVKKHLSKYYPKAGAYTPIAYLWARTVLSEAPTQGEYPVEIPLIRSMWLARKGEARAIRWKRDKEGAIITELVKVTYSSGREIKVLRPVIEIFSPQKSSDVGKGTIARNSATCPVTGHTTPADRVQLQLKQRKGGAFDARLYCVVCTSESAAGRTYLTPDSIQLNAYQAALDELQSSPHLAPDEPLPEMSGVFNAPLYGHSTWGSLFNARQLIALNAYSDAAKTKIKSLTVSDPEYALAFAAAAGILVDRLADLNASLCVWQLSTPNTAHVFGRWALPMIMDYGEVNPLSGAGGSPESSVWRIASAIRDISSSIDKEGEVNFGSADTPILPADCADAWLTDPPYYNAIPYADISDFFYIWLRRTIGEQFPDLFKERLINKSSEICEMAGWDPVRYPHKDKKFFENRMTATANMAREYIKPGGIAVIVFAHKSTVGWEAMLQAVIDAGWTITASWPIDTEMASRLRARNSAALASSVHLVCRPLETANGDTFTRIGDWRDVLQELPIRIHEWMPRLAREGIVGADAIFACLGPALEIFSRYSRVEKASGDQVTLRDYLEHVWAAVSKEALSSLITGADLSTLETDARITAMWLWTLNSGSATTEGDSDGEAAAEEDAEEEGGKGSAKTGFLLEYDAARKIAQGLGANLEDMRSVVAVKGDEARLLPVAERTAYLFGKDQASTPENSGRGRKKKAAQMDLFAELTGAEATEAESVWEEKTVSKPGATVLDRVHQSMILFATGRGEALKRFLVEDGIGREGNFWKLAQALSALYPSGSQEKRWVDGVLARKKGLGL